MPDNGQEPIDQDKHQHERQYDLSDNLKRGRERDQRYGPPDNAEDKKNNQQRYQQSYHDVVTFCAAVAA